MTHKKNPKPRLDKKTGARLGFRKGPKLSRHAMEEFGPGKTDVILCPEGDAVYYYKSWHHDLEKYRELRETKAVTFKLCPFHEMKKNRQWEGEVNIFGVPEEFRAELLQGAKNLSNEAQRRDPMHRILDIKTTKDAISIFTSENQLAQQIAKRIRETHKHHIEEKIHRAKESDAVLITMKWIAG
ncbi:MAG: hypothetical protein HYS44_00620 [Candidatus Niyogibacteria bacterium]|nr:hypothetical protein [Candidatus Niyogibacteria bacterium]